MANIRDVYELDTKADTSGIDQGTAALKKQSAGVDDLGKKASGATGGLGKMLGSLKEIAAGGSLNAIQSIGGALKSSISGMADKAFGGVGKLAGALKGMAGAPVSAIKSVGSALKSGVDQLAKFGQAMEAVQKISQSIGQLFTALAGVSPEFAGEMELIKTQIGNLRDLLLQPIASALTPVLRQFQEILLSDTFVNFITTIGPQIGSAFAQIAGAVLPLVASLASALLPVLMNLITAVLPVIVELINGAAPILMSLVTDAFAPLLSALLPIVGTLAEALLPVLVQLVGELLPVLAPLFVAIADVLVQVLGALMPVVQELLNALLPIIVQLIQTLLPPFTQLLLSVADVLVTLLQALGPVVVELVEGLAPIISLVAQLMAENLIIAMNLLAAFVRDVLGPAIEWLSQNVIGPLVGILQSVSGQIQTVVDAMQSFHDSMMNITLPDWLTPGSPTPFEMGLRGIADAMNALPSNPIQASFTGAAPAAVAGATGGLVVNLTINGPFGAGYTPESAGRAAGDAFVKAARAHGVAV